MTMLDTSWPADLRRAPVRWALSPNTVTAQLAGGRPIVVLGADRGDLVASARHIAADTMAFLVRYTSGFVCVALTDERAAQLGLPLLFGSADSTTERFAVSVDAADGVTTGISAADRARTARLLGSPGTSHLQLSRPGHVVPLRVADTARGVARTPAEWALNVLRRSGIALAAVAATIVSERNPADLAGPDELAEFAARHGLVSVRLPSADEHAPGSAGRTTATPAYT